jgi:hypothetical protein
MVLAGGFGVEDEFGVSGEGGFDFAGGVGEAAADGTFEAVDVEHDPAVGDPGAQGPFQNVFVDAQNIPTALLEQAGGVGVMVDGVAVVKTVLPGDAGGAVPLDEFEFDPDAIGMVAAGALAAGRRMVWSLPWGIRGFQPAQ